jgi:hypothetical protein
MVEPPSLACVNQLVAGVTTDPSSGIHVLLHVVCGLEVPHHVHVRAEK